jgi:SAM-dependent methyltransferase
MTALDQTLLDTQRAFDSIAAGYDDALVANVALHALRERTRVTVVASVPPGSRLLDLGCGSGRDAAWFGQRGYRVVAIDWSPEMVHQARRHVADLGLTGVVDVRHCGIHDVDRRNLDWFDGAYSDLGPLNCVPELEGVARRIGACLRRDGVLVASVMARVCPWEILLHAARGEFARARVRFARTAVAVPLGSGTAWTRYYSPRRFARPFLDAGFQHESLRSVGLSAPPPYCEGFANRHASLVSWLQRVDDTIGTWPGVCAMGDHFLMVLRKARDVHP